MLFRLSALNRIANASPASTIPVGSRSSVSVPVAGYLAGGALLAAVAVIFYELRARLQSFAALSAMQAVRLMNQGALVIDLRNKESFDAGHIGEARNVPAAELESQAESLKKWRDKTVITYCDSGDQRRRRRAHTDEARLQQGLQSGRRHERLAQG